MSISSSRARRERLEYLESIEFPTPAEFAELRELLEEETSLLVALLQEAA